MRNYDFAPLYRSTVGFDNLTSLLDAVIQRDQNQSSYPPYNIELVEDNQYRITMAVAGFSQDEIDIHVEQQTLTIAGSKESRKKENNFLHRGIAARNFEQRFQLADYIEVKNANLENGLLHIKLSREIPEAMKPRKIDIDNGATRLINMKKTAAA